MNTVFTQEQFDSYFKNPEFPHEKIGDLVYVEDDMLVNIEVDTDADKSVSHEQWQQIRRLPKGKLPEKDAAVFTMDGTLLGLRSEIILERSTDYIIVPARKFNTDDHVRPNRTQSRSAKRSRKGGAK